MAKGKAKFAQQDAADRFRSAVIVGEQGGLGDLATERGSGSKVVDGVTSHANAEDSKQRQTPMRAAQAMPPTEGVNDFGDGLDQDERNQSPAQRGQFPPKLADADPREQVGQERDAQDEQQGMQFLHG